MKWERLGRKVALDVALGLNYLHAQVSSCSILHCLRAIPVLMLPEECTTQSVCLSPYVTEMLWKGGAVSRHEQLAGPGVKVVVHK
jgi:hypothetical protein